MIREQINCALKTALETGDKRRAKMLRLINAAIADRAGTARGRDDEPLSDGEVLDLLRQMVAQRAATIREYEEAGRLDVARQEYEEMEILKTLLPPTLGEPETRHACESVLREMGGASLKDVGRIMGKLKERYKDKMDFSLASRHIKDMLK
jgi:uncharacterized protein YqeY